MGKDKKTEPKYYTVNQLAEYSNLSVSTIRRYIKYEGLPHFRINRRILISIDEFDNWMERRRKKQMAEEIDLDHIVQEVKKEFGI